MDYKTIAVEKGKIARLVLNRPEKANAFNAEMVDEINDALGKLAVDEEIRVLIITGASKWFSSGADLTAGWGYKKLEMVEKEPEKYWRGEMAEVENCLRIMKMGKPVIAALNGPAMGMAFELALSCDIRIASETAQFNFPQTLMGIQPVTGFGLVPPLVGLSQAKKLFWKGPLSYPDFISARRALELGLVDELVPPEKFDQRIKDYTADLAEIPPLTVRFIKETLNFEHVKNFESMCHRGHLQQFFLRSPGWRDNIKKARQVLESNFRGSAKRSK